VGVLSKADINEAVRNDLGDMSMSGWRRGNPHEVVGRFDVEGSAVAMTPAKRSRGPMRVLQQGRNNWAEGKRWEPQMSPGDREWLFDRWRQAVTRTFDWVPTGQ